MEDKKLLDKALNDRPGVTSDYKTEWGWERWMVGGKMFAAICTPSDKYDKAYSGRTLLTLKCEPENADVLKDNFADILSGFYMDKRTWISIILDGEVPDELIVKLCDDSYRLVFSKLTKKLQKEITEAC